jgi:hypothetical protein
MLESILLEWRCKWVKFISFILKALKEQKCNDNENVMKNENDDVKTFEFFKSWSNLLIIDYKTIVAHIRPSYVESWDKFLDSSGVTHLKVIIVFLLWQTFKN